MSKSKINFPVVIILMTVLLDSMGIGIMIPVMPELFKSVLPNSTTADASVWAGALASIFALMQFLFGPLLGTLSDRVGRKPVILISLIVMVWYYLIMAVAQTVWLLLIGRIVGGITAATHATASAPTPAADAAGVGADRLVLSMLLGFGVSWGRPCRDS